MMLRSSEIRFVILTGFVTSTCFIHALYKTLLCLQYLEKKDELELKCEMLKKDSRMYCNRMEDIVKQLEEVIKERDKVTIVSSLKGFFLNLIPFHHFRRSAFLI